MRKRNPTTVTITIEDIYRNQVEHTKELAKIREEMEKHHERISGKIALARNIATGAATMASATLAWFVAHLYR